MSESSGVIQLGQERLAAGLFWQPAPSAAAAAREAKLVAAKTEVRADLFCVRRRGVPQYGLGQQKVGHRAGMRAVAALLAGGIGRESWIGVFDVDGRWLFVMVREGTILPDGDFLFALENDAKDRFHVELAAVKWSRIYCPAAWDVPDTRVGDVRSLLGRTADAKLRSVAFDAATPAGIGMVALLVGFGLWWLMIPKAVVPVPDVPVAPPPPPAPWIDEPVPSWLIETCAAAIAIVPIMPGFDIENVSCGRAGVEATYLRRSGSLAWLPSDFQVRSADRVTHHSVLPSPPMNRLAGEQSWLADDLRRRVWSAAQTFSLDSEITETTAKIAPGHIAALPERYRELTVTLGGPLGPAAFMAILGSIPTFVVEEVSWRSAGWKVKGEAYVR